MTVIHIIIAPQYLNSNHVSRALDTFKLRHHHDTSPSPNQMFFLPDTLAVRLLSYSFAEMKYIKH